MTFLATDPLAASAGPAGAAMGTASTSQEARAGSQGQKATAAAASGPSPEQWDAAVALVEQAVAAGTTIGLLAHVNPDGDALGSALALGLALQSRGARVVVSFEAVPFGVPANLRFLPGQHMIVAPEQFPDDVPLVITFDTGSLDRLGVLAPVAATTPAVLVIDHHRSNTGFGTDLLLDVTAASTTEVVAALVDKLGVPLSEELATALYVGLVTDTGSFRYSATSPESHELAARLLRAGVRHAEVNLLVWDTRPLGYLPLLAAALGRVKLWGDVVWTWVSVDDLEAAGVGLEEAESIIDVVRTAEQSQVAVVLKQDVDGSWRVSTRSRGKVDVGAACGLLGGGGHQLAAGFTSRDDAATTLEKFRAAVARAAPLTS